MSRLKKTKQDKVFDIANHIFLTILLFMIAYPIYFVVTASFSDPAYVNLGQTVLYPRGLNIEGYKIILSYKDIWTGYKNSIIYTVLGTAINLVVLLPAGFALSRKELPGRAQIMIFFVITMYFTGGIIPTYLLIRDLGFINKIWAVVLPGALNVYNMIICRSFFSSTIPDELLESAKIDGAGYTRFFLSIVLPLSQALIAVMVLFHALGHWNSYLKVLFYIRDRDKYSLQMVLREIMNRVDYAQMENMDPEEVLYQERMKEVIKYSVIIVASIPVMLLYPFVQKYFIKGVMIGALKG